MNTRVLTKDGDGQASQAMQVIQPRVGTTIRESLIAAVLFIGGLLTFVWIGLLFWLPGYAIGIW